MSVKSDFLSEHLATNSSETIYQTLREHLHTHKVCKISGKIYKIIIVILPKLPKDLLKIICSGYLLELPP